MNPFINPITGLPFLKSYLSDPKRLHRHTFEEICKYRDRVLRKAVRYAYSVPVYHNKYKKSGVNPEDIKKINDIEKLPFITKKDLIESFPDNVIPKGYNKKNGVVECTSGSTGKPVSFYADFATLSKAIMLFFRQSHVYNFNWRKDKVVSLGNFSRNKADNVMDEVLVSKSKLFRHPGKYLTLNAFSPMKEILKELNDFKPDVLLSYPITFQQLAYFKKKGYADNINPKIITVGGYMLDEYTRKYVEDAFGCPMVNIYSSAESNSDIAFECLNHTWHINYDFYHLEAIDENMELVSPGELGHVVMTRLFGKGTPIIRYTGMDDWIRLISDYKCDCGLRTPIIKGGVEGRRSTSVILPDGRIFPSASFAIISLILNKLKTFKVKQFQIVQKKIDEIEILIVIDEDLRNVGIPIEEIFTKIKEAYVEMCGPNVNISVKETKEIKSPPGKPLPLVISKVKMEEALKLIE